jgi:hypothetical protein
VFCASLCSGLSVLECDPCGRASARRWSGRGVARAHRADVAPPAGIVARVLADGSRPSAHRVERSYTPGVGHTPGRSRQGDGPSSPHRGSPRPAGPGTRRAPRGDRSRRPVWETGRDWYWSRAWPESSRLARGAAQSGCSLNTRNRSAVPRVGRAGRRPTPRRMRRCPDVGSGSRSCARSSH